jgi:hypothetical protein
LTEKQIGKSEEGMKTEEVAKPKRCQHTAEYKLRILHGLDECTGRGKVGTLLRGKGRIRR